MPSPSLFQLLIGIFFSLSSGFPDSPVSLSEPGVVYVVFPSLVLYSSLLFSAFPDPLSVPGVLFVSVHGPENAVDGDISTYWQSPPISRGRKYNRVDLEINLLQDFIVRT
jgi:hypothetical protein